MTTAFILTAIVVVCGATVSSMAGFGFIIVTMPFLLMLHPAKTAVALSLSIALCGVLIQWFRVRQHVDYRLTAKLCLGALFGVPLGSYILSAVDPTLLKLLVGLSVLVGAGLHVLRREEPNLPPRVPSSGMLLAAGFTSGVLAASVGQSGPPVAFVLAWARLDKAVVRATLVTFFVAVDFGSLFAMSRTGVLTREIVLTALGMVPFYVVGLFLGDYFFKRSNQGAYRRLIMAVLTVAAVMAVINGLSVLV